MEYSKNIALLRSLNPLGRIDVHLKKSWHRIKGGKSCFLLCKGHLYERPGAFEAIASVVASVKHHASAQVLTGSENNKFEKLRGVIV